MNENENVRIDPESAYVKSMDYLDKVIAEAELTSQKIGKYRIACAVISVLLGARRASYVELRQCIWVSCPGRRA